MNKYEKRTNIKKESIVKASIELFNEKGFSETKIHEIAKKAHVSQVSIYNYFKSKEALVYECIIFIRKDLNKKLLEILNENISFEEKLKKVINLNNDYLYRKINESFAKSYSNDETLKRLILESIDRIQSDMLLTFIEQGKKEGVINNISTESILDIIKAINLIGINLPEESIFEKTDDFINLLLYGIIGK